MTSRVDGAPVQRVLLIEDDEDDALIVADDLQPWPEFGLRSVPTLADGLRALTEQAADCVLLDLNLPDAVGLEGLAQLLAHDGDMAIVVLTGDIDGRRGPAAVAAGAQDYLVKGRGDADGLVRAIRYAIERRRSARWRHQIAVAEAQEAENARLQRGLLPAPIVRRDAVAVASYYRPGGSQQFLGGDFYDVVESADGEVHALIGDVCGHGPDEAALGVSLRIAWRTLVLSGASPATMFGTLDRLLAFEREDDSLFTTATQLTVSADRTRATVQIAGHPHPVLMTVGCRPRALSECAHGPALGIATAPSWPQTTVSLGTGWTLLLYTDGLSEARSGDGRLGDDGLIQMIDARADAARPIDEHFLQQVLADVTERNAGPLTDDIAIVALSDV